MLLCILYKYDTLRWGGKAAAMKRFFAKWKEWCPVTALVFFGIAIVAAVVEGLSKSHIGLADAINDTSGVAIRAVLSALTSWLPFSLAETALLLSPALIAWIVITIVRHGKQGASHAVRYAVSLLSVAALVYGIFVFGYGTGYYGKTIDQKLGMERNRLSAEELYQTSMILADRAAAELDQVNFPTGSSVMPFSYRELGKKLSAAYDTLCDDYPSFQRMHSSVKPVVLSEPWTYTHLSGVYCFFSGEANININYPDYIVVSSAAHEMAHQRGICREDEANFVSFLVCIRSDDPYIRYCGYAETLETVLSKLYSANSEMYRMAKSQIAPEILGEYTAYSEFFEKYRENRAATVTQTVNGSYIAAHGQPDGVKSYGLVADLVASYLLYGDGQ